MDTARIEVLTLRYDK